MCNSILSRYLHLIIAYRIRGASPLVGNALSGYFYLDRHRVPSTLQERQRAFDVFRKVIPDALYGHALIIISLLYSAEKGGVIIAAAARPLPSRISQVDVLEPCRDAATTFSRGSLPSVIW